jgi:hypothetical protein
MAITLRTDQSVELTYQEADENFSSLFYSASISGNTLSLYYTGSQFAPTINPVNITIPEGSKWTGSLSVISRESDVQVTGSLKVTGPVTGSTAQITNIPEGIAETRVVVVDNQGNTKYRTDLSLQGPAGATGAQGTTGTTGAQGTTGTTGTQGATGTAGAQGTTGAQGTSGAGALVGDVLGNPGYQQFSNGLIIQWGTFTALNGTTYSPTFPISFPNAILSMTITKLKSAATADGWIERVSARSTTGFTVTWDNFDSAGTGNSHSIQWIAIGN